jgi:serine/threonine-protein kinase
VTQAGTILGSPDYMSPEQARGDEGVDFRADVWAFCVVLYECITGSVPFEDPNYNALLRKIIEQPPAPILEFGAGDESLWTVIARGLGKKPEERWANMRELGVALAQWLLTHGITEDACGQSLRSHWTEPRASMHDGNTLRNALKKSFPPSSDLATIPPPASSAPSEGGTRAAMAVSGQRRLKMTAAGRRIALIAGAGALAVLILLVLLTGRSSPPTADRVAASAAVAPKAAAPTGSARTPATLPAPTTAAPASQAASKPDEAGTSTTRERAAKKPRALAPSATQSAAPKARPKTYDDFGF